MINSLLLLMWHQEVWRANETKDRAALKDKQQIDQFFLKVHLWVNENYFASATCDPWRNDVLSKSSEKVRLIGEIGIRSHKQILAERLIIKRTERGGIWIEPSLATPCRRYHSICYPLASYMRVAICYFQERAAFLEGFRSSWHNRFDYPVALVFSWWLRQTLTSSRVTDVLPETQKSLLHSEKALILRSFKSD